MPALNSEESTAASTLKTAFDAKTKKKHMLLDSWKPKERPGNAHSYAASPASPLPPLTPKAAKVLGVAVEETEPPETPSHNSRNGRQEVNTLIQMDGSEDKGRPGPWVQTPQLRKMASEPMLTAFKNPITEIPPSHSNFGALKKGKKKAMRMIDLFPSFSSREKGASAVVRFDPLGLPGTVIDDEKEYSSDSDLHSSSSTLHRPSSQKLRKKNRKSLQKMPPITEASPSEDSIILAESDDAELDVIQEYHDRRMSTISLPRSATTPNFPRIMYKFESQNFTHVEEDDWKDQMRHGPNSPIFGAVPDYSELHGRSLPGPVQIQTLRQPVEGRLHNQTLSRTGNNVSDCDTPGSFEAEQRISQNKAWEFGHFEEEKAKLDREVLRLQDNQRVMKREFLDIPTRKSSLRTFKNETVPGGITLHTEDKDNTSPSDFEDLGPGESSGFYDDEEPEICVCMRVSTTKVTREMIKRIELPAKSTHAVSKKVDSTETGRAYKVNDNATRDQMHRVSTPKGPPPIVPHPTSRVAYPYKKLSSSPSYGENHEHNTVSNKSKKRGPLREESRLFVQDWVNTHDASQRPLSSRFDPYVIAERAIPPATLPKDGTVPSLRPPLPSRSPLRQCAHPTNTLQSDALAMKPVQFSPKSPKSPKSRHVHSGHVFAPRSVASAPGYSSMEAQAARPYMLPLNGTLKGDHVPVKCEKCGITVEEKLWKYSPTTRQTLVCFKCALVLTETDTRRARSRKDAVNAAEGAMVSSSS